MRVDVVQPAPPGTAPPGPGADRNGSRQCLSPPGPGATRPDTRQGQATAADAAWTAPTHLLCRHWQVSASVQSKHESHLAASIIIS
jgi:hypothetical protein